MAQRAGKATVYHFLTSKMINFVAIKKCCEISQQKDRKFRLHTVFNNSLEKYLFTLRKSIVIMFSSQKSKATIDKATFVVIHDQLSLPSKKL